MLIVRLNVFIVLCIQFHLKNGKFLERVWYS